MMNLPNEHDEAILMACKKFDELHADHDEPKWLKYCMSLNITKNERKNWVVKFLIVPKSKLEYNQYWDWQADGNPYWFKSILRPIKNQSLSVAELLSHLSFCLRLKLIEPKIVSLC